MSQMKKLLFMLLISTGSEVYSQNIAQFLLQRDHFTISPSVLTYIIGTSSESIDFEIAIDRINTSTYQFHCELVGASIPTPIPLSLRGESRIWPINTSDLQEPGEYQLVNIRLEDNNHNTLAFASPSHVTIKVLDNILVTGVEVREMRQAELASRGYLFLPKDYRVLAFQLALVTAGKSEVIELPIALPREPNRDFQPVVLEDPFQPPVILDLLIPMKIEQLDGDATRTENRPNFYSLLLIPGELTYLKSHFSVTGIVFNASSPEDQIVVSKLKAELQLPGTQVGGLPLIYHDAPIKPVRGLGADRQLGTDDDTEQLAAGEEGRASFLISGELEGLYPVKIQVQGELQLENKRLQIDSVGRGKVFVRNADYTVTVEHPETVSLDEPYDFTMTFHNIGKVFMEDFQVHLDATHLIGTELNGSDPTQALGNLDPGMEKSIVYHMRSKQTGKVAYSYFNADGAQSALLNLSIGVGQSGERLSNASLVFPKSFYNYVPTSRHSTLRRYFKKLWDFSLMPTEQLPAGLLPFSSGAVSTVIAQLAQIGYENEAGVPDERSITGFVSEWLRSTSDMDSLDRARQHISRELPLEAELGGWLGQVLESHSAREVLELFSQAADEHPLLRVAIIEGQPSKLQSSNGTQSIDLLQGERLPFSSLLQLSQNRSLLWFAGAQENISLSIEGGQEIAWLCKKGNAKTFTQAQLDLAHTNQFEVTNEGVVRWKKDQNATTIVEGIALKDTQLELLFAKQMDPSTFPDVDSLGRNLVFAFNIPIDLASIEPLNEHFFINGEPVSAIESPYHQRFLIVRSPMPLGPYKPIHYQILGMKAKAGVEIPSLEGLVTASNHFVGVSAFGQVVDHQGTELAGARVFLMQPTMPNFDDLTLTMLPLSEGERRAHSIGSHFPVVQETRLDSNGNYRLDFIAMRNLNDTGITEINHFKIGILLADGRYREQEFAPDNAVGAEIQADFAFGARGVVVGTVFDSEGQPIPFAPIYAISQTREASSAITKADLDGKFLIQDLDVGQILLKSRNGPFIGRASGYLTALNSPLQIDLHIYADQAGAVSGHVFALGENGEEQPIADAWVGLIMDESFEVFQSESSYNLSYTAGTRSDETGHYRMEQLRTGLGEIYFYHPKYGLKKRLIDIAAGENPNQDQLMALAPLGSIRGFVVNQQGQPVAGATVQVENQVTVSQSDGSFEFQKLPLGKKRVVAKLANKEGAASLILTQEQPNFNLLSIQILDPISISGSLVDAKGKPLPFREIHSFIEEELPPAQKDKTNLEDYIDSLSSDEIYSNYEGLWHYKAPVASLYSQQEATPIYQGFTGILGKQIAEKRFLSFPHGGSQQVDLIERRYFPLVVKVVDAQGNPVIADILLTSQVPSPAPKRKGIAVENLSWLKSDQNGFATFQEINEGPVQLVAQHALLGTTEAFQVEWMTPELAATVIQLSFHATELAQLSGRVYDVDGLSPAPLGTLVQASFLNHDGVPIESVIATDVEGNYSFANLTETGEGHEVSLTYFEPESGKFERDTIRIQDAISYRHDVILRGNANLHVQVVHSNGSPADFASVELSFPKLNLIHEQLEVKASVSNTTLLEQTTLEQPVAHFEGVTAGEIQLIAHSGTGFTALRSLQVPAGVDLTLQLRLEASSSISGTFLTADGSPIPDAEVGLLRGSNLLSQHLSSHESGNQGGFNFAELPMRTYTLHGEDPSSAQTAEIQVTTTPFENHPHVALRIDSTIELTGVVDQNDTPIVGAEVCLTTPLGQKFITATDETGRYNYSNLAAGVYQLNVRRDGHSLDPYFDAVALEKGQTLIEKDLHLARRATIRLTVLDPMLQPKPYVSVSVMRGIFKLVTVMTDANGQATLPHIFKQRVDLSLYDPLYDQSQQVSFSLANQDPDLVARTVQFDGWGTLFGKLSTASGEPLSNVPMFAAGQSFTCDANGYFRITYLPLHEPIELRAFNTQTFETASQTLTLDQQGQELEANLSFTPSTSVAGQLVYASGQGVADATIHLYRPIYREIRTDADGHFRIEPILIGDTAYKIVTRDHQRVKRGTLQIEQDPEGQLIRQSELRLELDQAAPLIGSARYADGKALSAGTVRLLDAAGQFLEESILFSDGSWRFPLQPLGEYQLQLHDTTLLYSAEPLLIHSNTDGQTLNSELVMPQAWQVSGRLLSPQSGEPISEAWVELWKEVSNRSKRIYAGELNDQGYFALERVFPGNYQIKAWNPDHSLVYEGPLQVTNQDLLQDFQLDYRASLSGMLSDNQNRPLKGTLEFSQAGHTSKHPVRNDGQFLLENLKPGPFTIKVDAAGGWIRFVQTGQLQPGSNSLALLSTEKTVQIQGQAFLAAANNPGFRAEIYLEDIGRPLVLDPSGQFLIDQVPIHRPVFLKLFAGELRKTIALGSFQQDTDIGQHPLEPILIDRSAPLVSFADQNQVIEHLPWNLELGISDPDSPILPESIRVWINGADLTQRFFLQNGVLSANFPYFPDQMRHGNNSLEVEVANSSNNYTRKTFHFEIQQAGALLVLDFQYLQQPTQASFQLGQDEWQTSAADGLLLLPEVAAGTYACKAKSSTAGLRTQISVDDARLTQYFHLQLQPVGEYRGRVLDLAGQGVPDQAVEFGALTEYTNPEGDYRFELLPLGQHQLRAESGALLSQVKGPVLTLPNQVALHVDLPLQGRGSVAVLVRDSSTGLPAANMRVQLSYSYEGGGAGLPALQAFSDATGQLLFENVLTYEFQVHAFDSQLSRYGATRAKLNQAGEQISLEILLDQSASVTGRLLHSTGEAAAHFPIEVTNDKGFSLTAESDAQGQFTILGLPNERNVSIRGADLDSGAFFYIVQDFHNYLVDVGELVLEHNQSPQLQLSFPTQVEPNAPSFFYGVIARDDYQLKNLEIAFSGSFESYSSHNLATKLASTGGTMSLPGNLNEGSIHYRVHAVDFFGLEALQEGEILVQADLNGPQIAISEPLANSSFQEGEPLLISGAASDPDGVTSVALYYKGVLLASGPGNFKFASFAPAVTEQELLHFDLIATDREGHLGYASVPLHITPKTTAQGPQIELHSPLPELPLPLHLEEGLELALIAKLADPDGLAYYQWRLGETLIAEGMLFGPQVEIHDQIHLPAFDASIETLYFQLRVFDLGDNPTQVNFQVHHIEGIQPLAELRLTEIDTRLDGENLILSGGRHLIDGVHSFQNLVLVNGAVLSQSPSTSDQTHVAATKIQVAEKLVLDATSQIAMDGTGYVSSPQQMAASKPYAFAGPCTLESSSLANIYGSFLMPTVPGSGQGGGAVQLSGAELWLLGKVSALPLQNPYASIGSGGSIWVQAEQFHGFGKLLANGYLEAYERPSASGNGSGGRIAIEGAFAGEAQAFGSNASGGGTIYRRVPDPHFSDGYFDQLQISSLPEIEGTKANAIPILTGLMVGRDVRRTQVTENGNIDLLDFLTPDDLPWQAFLGMRVYREGDPANGGIVSQQRMGQLRSAPGTSFGNFAEGDVIRVDYQVDEVFVSSAAVFHPNPDLALPSLRVQDASLVANARAELLHTQLVAQGTVRLKGDFLLANHDLRELTALQVEGQLEIDRLELEQGAHRLVGKIKTPYFRLGTAALLQMPFRQKDGMLEIEADRLEIAGAIRATQQLPATNSTHESHGGLGTGFGESKTYGSLYRPLASGNSIYNAGGVIHLQFQELQLEGSLDASADNSLNEWGSGGSVLLEGQRLLGSGSIRANAKLNSRSGGGRVAVLVQDQSNFSGQVEALPGSYSTQSGAVGTLYFKSQEWPKGRLVVDQHLIAHQDEAVTLLPGLGVRTASYATGAGPTIHGENFPNSLAGLYVSVEGHEPVRIDHNSATELFAEPGQSFPPLAVGQSYSGLHLLDRLEILNLARFSSPDPILLREPLVLEAGATTIDTVFQGAEQAGNYADGDFELPEGSYLAQVNLSNATLRVNASGHVGRLTMDAQSKVILNQDLTLDQLEMDGGTLVFQKVGEAPALLGNAANLRNGAAWIVGERISSGPTAGSAYPLVAEIKGTLSIDASSSIHTYIATTYPTSTPSEGALWNGSRIHWFGNGGFLNGSYNADQMVGSFAQPGLWVKRMAGYIHLKAQALQLEGAISAEGPLTDTGYGTSGGSIWLEAPLLSGNGTISARGDKFMGGGRIALHTGPDQSFLNSLQIKNDCWVTATSNTAISGSGSLFLKRSDQSYGDLILDQGLPSNVSYDNLERTQRLQGIAGLPHIVLALNDNLPDPYMLQDLSWTTLPPGLAGLVARMEIDGQSYEARIIDNSPNSLTFRDPLPEIVPAGTKLEFVLKLDHLVLKNGAMLHFPGLVEPAAIVTSGAFNSIWARDFLPPQEPFRLDHQNLRLILEEPKWENRDLELQDSQLLFDKPIQVHDIQLTRSWIRNSNRPDAATFERFMPQFELSANIIHADGQSGFQTRNESSNGPTGSHGGYDGSYPTYDNPFHPTLSLTTPYPRNYLKLNAQELHGGNLVARMEKSAVSAASIELHAQHLSGAIHFDASASGVTAGRIAAYYESAAPDALLTFDARSATESAANFGAGTSFYRGPNDTYGHLIIDNGTSGKTRTTLIPSFGIKNLGGFSLLPDAQSQGYRLTVPSLTIKENFRDYYLAINGQPSRSHRILASAQKGSAAEFLLESDPSPLLASDQIQLALWLDSLTLGANASLSPSDLLIFDQNAPQISLLKAPQTLSPGQSFQVEVQANDNIALERIELEFLGQIYSASQSPALFELIAPSPLVAADYPVRVSAFDRSALATTQQASIHILEVDQIAPSIALLAPEANAPYQALERFDSQLQLDDNRALAQVSATFNGQAQVQSFPDHPASIATSFSWTAPQLSEDRLLTLSVTLTDEAGNSSTSERNLLIKGENAAPEHLFPVAYWNFNAKDSPGNKALNLISGAPANYAVGYLNQSSVFSTGNSFGFAHISHKIEVPDAPLLSQELTLEAWVKASSFAANGGIATLGSEDLEAWAITTQSAGGNHFRFSAGGESVQTAATDTNWHHLVGTFKNGQLALYLDGQLAQEKQVAFNEIPIPANSWLQFGVHHPGLDSGFYGYLDEFLIWDKALSASRVQDHFQAWQANQIDLRPPESVGAITAIPEPNALNLEWTPTTNSDLDAELYLVHVAGVGDFSLPFGTHALRIEGLTPLTPYRVTVATQDTKGNHNLGLTTTFATDALLGELPQPKVYYNFESKDSANRMLDLRGQLLANYANGYINQAGSVGNSFGFGHISHAVESVDRPFLTSGTFALGFWFKINGSSADATLLSLGTRSQEFFSVSLETLIGSEPALGLRVQLGEKNTPTFARVGTRISPSGRKIKDLPLYSWQHLGLSFEHGLLQLYLNGEWVQELNLNVSLNQNPLAFLSFARSCKMTQAFNGNLDEFVYWDKLPQPAIFPLIYELGQKSKQMPDFSPPEEPTKIKLTPSQNQIHLTWTASLDSKHDLDHYLLEVQDGVTQVLSKNQTSYTLSGLQPSTSYQIRLVSVDRANNQSPNPSFFAATLPSSNTEVQPFSYWSFDTSENFGSLLVDLRGNLKALLANGYKNQTGLFPTSQAYGYGHSSHYFDSQAPPLDSAAFGLSFWFMTSAFSNDATLFSLGNSRNEWLSISQQSSGGKHLRVQLGDQSSTQFLDAGSRIASNNQVDSELSINKWHHFAVSIENQRLKLYLDGILAAEQSFSSLNFPEIQQAFMRVAKRSTGTDPAAFTIDEMTYWNQPLSPYIIALLYQNGIAERNLKGPALDLVPPAEPTNLVATPAEETLTLQWSASTSPDLAGYRVYLDEQLVAEPGNQTQATLSNLTPATSFEARVTAFDHEGNETAGLKLAVASMPPGEPGLPAPLSYWSLNSASKVGGYFQDVMARHPASYNVGYVQANAIEKEAWSGGHVSHHVDINGTNALDTSDAFTLFTWVYALNWTQNAGLITYGSDALETYGLVLGLDGANGKRIRFQSNGGGSELLETPLARLGNNIEVNPFVTHSWYQLAVSFDHGLVRLYVNGRKLAETTWSTSSLPVDALRKLVLGMHHPGADIGFNGYLDEVAIWNQSLSEAELRVFFLKGLRHEPLWSNLSDKVATQLASRFESDESFEDFDNIVLVHEQLRLRDFQTSKRLWLRDTRLEVEGQLEATSIHLLEGSLLTYAPKSSRESKLVAQHLQIDASSRLDFQGKPASLQVAELEADATSSGILVHELLLEGEIRARDQNGVIPDHIKIQADLISGEGLFLADQISPQREPEQPDQPQQKSEQPDKGILPEKRHKERNPGPREGNRESPTKGPGAPPKQESDHVLRIKGSRKQSFRILKNK